jgi:hypothetical protein
MCGKFSKLEKLLADPPNRLRDNTMLSFHSKPCGPKQTADSQNQHQCEMWGATRRNSRARERKLRKLRSTY